MRRWLFGLALLLAALTGSSVAAEPTASPDVTLTGTVTRANHETYLALPFQVPAGVRRVTIAFDYDRTGGTTIDLGLEDNRGFRGWSGGNKALFFVAPDDATPSYLPGPIRAGTWKLILGVPNARVGASTPWRARIWFERGPPARPVPARPFPRVTLNPAAGWYRGDLHLHTEHSDGSCAAPGAEKAPCPLVRTLGAARAAGLDFIAITDHNATSQFAPMAALQGSWSGLLLIPGREITTFRGHANILGPTGFIDFRIGSSAMPTLAALQAKVARDRGFFIINHPTLPSGEACMGCGWSWPDTDFTRVQAVEVVNGGAWKIAGAPDTLFSGIAWWDARLEEGYRLIGTGGSDNHEAPAPPAQPGAVGRPTTVVWARNLSTAAILEGLRSGRVWVDMGTGPGRRLEFSGRGESPSSRPVEMGGQMVMAQGDAGVFTARVWGVPGAKIEFIANNRPRDSEPAESVSGEVAARAWVTGGFNGVQYIRVNVRDAAGKLVMVGNPIWVSMRVDR